MLLGTDIQAVLTTLDALDVDVIGLNCSTGPEDMRDAIRFLGERSPLPVHCIPNAGLPLQGPDGETIFPETPEQISKVLGEFVERYERLASSAAAAGRRPITSARSPSVSAAACPAQRPEPGPPRGLEHDDLDPAGPGAARRRWSASGSTRRARARPRSCCSPTTTTASCRSPRTR